jgi:hypothetical protein
MFRSILALVLTSLLALAAPQARAAGAPAGDDERAAAAREKIEKKGVGPSARVEVRLRDKTKLKGYVNAADRDAFTIMDPRSGAARTVPYTDVASFGGGLSTRTKAIIWGSAAAAAIVVLYITRGAFCDGLCV